MSLEAVIEAAVERAVERAFARQRGTAPARMATRVVELTAKGIAADLGVSVSTLWRWRRAGQFPVGRELPGGRVRFDPVEVEEWKKARGRRPLR